MGLQEVISMAIWMIFVFGMCSAVLIFLSSVKTHEDGIRYLFRLFKTVGICVLLMWLLSWLGSLF